MVAKEKILIIGGGFAGWWAAKRLVRDTRAGDVEIVLVDQRPHITMLPALPDVVTGSVAPEYLREELEALLPGRVTVKTDRIERLDLDGRVATGARDTYGFDYLLLAAGSKPSFYGFSAPGETIYTLTSLEESVRIRDDFTDYLRNETQPHAVVVGAGYTGLELATALRNRADLLGSDVPITVVEKAPALLPFLLPEEREYIADYLKRRNVTIRLESTVSEFSDGTLLLDGELRIERPFFCWAAGAEQALNIPADGVPRARDGRILVDENLEVPGYPGVFVAGDGAAIREGEVILRRAINFSLYSGRHGGLNIARRVRGEEPVRFKPVDLGWVIPLSDISVGRVFGKFRVKGRLGMRLHYLMNGYRNFNARNFFAFFGHALRLPRVRSPRSAR
ncbi:MAG: FAD-dependent oxidoreductase [Spirochaetales bacterium]|nr:FAD-dependent oxidoreductase [Spirochaetales bacterium]